MNVKGKWLLWVLPLLVLSAALFGVRWKQEHPKITTQDLGVRRRFLQAKDAEATLVIKDSEGYSVHQISNQERKKIASHFWLSSKISSYNLRSHNLTIGWGAKSRLEFINLGDTPNSDVYYDATPDDRNAVAYQIHPVKSRYLRQWLATQPKFQRKTK